MTEGVREKVKTRNQQPNDKPAAAAVRDQLARIISSLEFQNSKRLSDFLSFVVNETLAGRDKQLKGYTIALAVLKRDENFDPDGDPIVRIEAGRLRRALEKYYLTTGVQDSLLITIPKGRYVPTFTQIEKLSSEQKLCGTSGESASLQPGLVVLPFSFMPEDSEQAYFADGINEELIVALNQYKDLRVISGAMIDDALVETLDIRRLGCDLDARFLLTGKIRGVSPMVRVSVQLFDTESAQQIWAQRYERELSANNLFAVQDDIIQNVITQLADQYQGAIGRTLYKESRRRTKSITAYQAVLHLHHYNRTFSYKAYQNARQTLEQAVKADPDYAIAWAALAELQIDGYSHNFTDESRDSALSNAFTSARRAVSLDPECDYAYWALGLTSLVARDKTSLLNAAESLIKLAPPPTMLALGGWMLAMANEWEPGLSILEEQSELVHVFPGWIYHAPFLNYYRQCDYKNALVESKKFDIPPLIWSPLERAAVLGQLGRIEEARIALDEALAIHPDFADDPYRYLNCFILQDELVEHVIEGLRKAGLE